LSNFLPAGTIQTSSFPRQTCSHTHAEDGWHTFLCDPNKEDGLKFLIEHKFILSTYNFTQDRANLILRIYLIPFDLENYGGKLRNRDEAKIMNVARKYLRDLLPMIVQDSAIWNGGSIASSSPSRFFLPVSVVCNIQVSLWLQVEQN